MSVYAATRADDLNRCLESLAEQSLTPTQIVLARDGRPRKGAKHAHLLVLGAPGMIYAALRRSKEKRGRRIFVVVGY